MLILLIMTSIILYIIYVTIHTYIIYLRSSLGLGQLAVNAPLALRLARVSNAYIILYHIILYYSIV